MVLANDAARMKDPYKLALKYEELVSKTSYIQSDMLLIFIMDLYGNCNKF